MRRRPSPETSAAASKEGLIARGGDGRAWVALSTLRRRRWVPLRSAHRGSVRPLTVSYLKRHAGKDVTYYARGDFQSDEFPHTTRGLRRETFRPEGTLCITKRRKSARKCHAAWKSVDALVSKGDRVEMPGWGSLSLEKDKATAMAVDSADPELVSENLLNVECFVVSP